MRWIRENEFDPRYTFWTRANLTEVFPEPPSPLGWDLGWERACLAGWRDAYVQRFGMDEDEVSWDRIEAIAVFGGYPYLGASLFRVWAGRTPGLEPTAIDQAYFGDHPDVPPYVKEPWHDNPRTTARMGEVLQWATTDMSRDELEADRAESFRVQASRPDLAALSDAALLGRAVGLRPLLRRMSCTSTLENVVAAVGPGMLGQVCAGIGRPALATRLMAGLGDVDSVAPALAMWDLSRTVRASAALTALFAAGVDRLAERIRGASEPDVVRFAQQFSAFVAEHGFRGPNEWDLMSPAWEVNPAGALTAIDRLRLAGDELAPDVQHRAREADRRAAEDEVRAAIAGDAEALGMFEVAIRATARFIQGRERAKTAIIRVMHEVRMAVIEIGRRAHDRGALARPDDIWFLFVDELEDLVAQALPTSADVAAERRTHHEWLASVEPPFIISGVAPPNTTWPARRPSDAPLLARGESIQGTPGAAGSATGRARIVMSPDAPMGLEPGDVLVAPFTDPSWTPLFVAAAAVVVDVGAPLSHAVIVSRELGIPCVPSAAGATSRIPDGALVSVNGDTGLVTMIELP